MHERALIIDLLREIEAVARQHGAGRVTQVDLWVGALSHLSDEGVRAAWSELARGTVAEGARVTIEVSDDRTHPRAGGLVLRRVGVSSGPAVPPVGGAAPRLRSAE